MTFLISGSAQLLQPNTMGETLWYIKNVFSQSGFTVVSSSDGTTLSAGDLTTSGTLNNANAYFIVKQPLSATGSHGSWRREWGFQRINATNIKVSYTVSSSHTNGGTASVMASGSDRKWVLENQSTWQVGTDAQFVEGDTRYMMVMAVDNTAPHAWYWIVTSVGSPGGADWTTYRRPSSCLFFDPMTINTFNTLDLDPTVHYSGLYSSNESCLDINGGLSTYLSGAGTAGVVRTWFAKSGSGAGTGFVSGVFTSCPIVMPMIVASTQLVQNVGTNFFNGSDETFPVWYIKPVIDTTNFVPVSAVKGISSLLSIGLTLRDNWTTYTVSSSKDKILLGNFLLPWDGNEVFR